MSRRQPSIRRTNNCDRRRTISSSANAASRCDPTAVFLIEHSQRFLMSSMFTMQPPHCSRPGTKTRHPPTSNPRCANTAVHRWLACVGSDHTARYYRQFGILANHYPLVESAQYSLASNHLRYPECVTLLRPPVSESHTLSAQQNRSMISALQQARHQYSPPTAKTTDAVSREALGDEHTDTLIRDHLR